jgi:hypothetical protein
MAFCRRFKISHAMSDSQKQKKAKPSRCAVTTGWAFCSRAIFDLNDHHDLHRMIRPEAEKEIVD